MLYKSYTGHSEVWTSFEARWYLRVPCITNHDWLPGSGNSASAPCLLNHEGRPCCPQPQQSPIFQIQNPRWYLSGSGADCHCGCPQMAASVTKTPFNNPSLLLTEFESGIQMDLFHVSFVYSILDNLYCLYHIRVQNNLDMFDNRTLNFLVMYWLTQQTPLS